MKKMRSLNVIVCTGKPNSGKTTFSTALGVLSASHKDNRRGAQPETTASSGYRLDKAYIDFLQAKGELGKGQIVNIAKHFPSLDTKSQDEFWDFMSKELDALAKTTQFTLIIEGWQGGHYLERLQQKFQKERFVHVAMEAGQFEVEGKQFKIPRTSEAATEKDQSFNHYKRALPANIAVAAELFCHLREVAIARLTSETKYQCFDDLGMLKTSSDSPAKFEALHLKDLLVVRPGSGPRKVLDVGCQSGNFSFRIARSSPRFRVVGVDANAKAVDLASRYNTQVYELQNIEFRRGDALDFSQKNFDLVIAASVFHYFREDQQKFLDKVYDMLKPGGHFVIECGISNEGGSRPHVQAYARGVDGDRPCFFPNRVSFGEMTRRFELRYEGDSLLQKGDPIPRKVFHLQRAA